MNSLFAKIFIILNNIISWILILSIVLFGLYQMSRGNVMQGVAIIVIGVIVCSMLFGIFAIFIENHKILKEILEIQKENKGA